MWQLPSALASAAGLTGSARRRHALAVLAVCLLAAEPVVAVPEGARPPLPHRWLLLLPQQQAVAAPDAVACASTRRVAPAADAALTESALQLRSALPEYY